MKGRRLLGRAVIAFAVVLAIVIGALSLFTPVQAAGCMCPMIYAPVQCDNGRIYSNGCVAACAHAKNCVPVGPGPIQL